MNQQSAIPYIVVGIDGTASRSWRRPDGSNSSVYKFVRDFNYGSIGTQRMYYHGPSDVMQGLESEPILQQALNFTSNRLGFLFPQIGQHHVRPLSMYDVSSCHQANERARVDIARENGGHFLGPATVRVPLQVNAQMLAGQILTTNQVRIVIVGHSRGGLIATLLARMLSPIVKVYFLGLYDAVDRQPCFDGDTVQNVQFVFHARRHSDVGSRLKTFGNTATNYQTDNRNDPRHQQFFNTSHGGIGGAFVLGQYETGITADRSCNPRPDSRMVVTRGGMATYIDNRHPLTRRLNRPIEQICAEGGQLADAYIRSEARRLGLPVQ